MQNISEDKYWYLSGEAKRGAIASNLKTQLRNLQEETDKKFDDLQRELIDDDALYIAKTIEESINKSVKPNVKTSYKKKKVELSKKTLAVGACALFIAGGLSTPHIINIAKNISTEINQTRVVSEEVNEFRKEVITPSTHYNNATDEKTEEKNTIHWHDYVDIVMNAKQQNEDPIIAFYMIYGSLDDYCRNEDLGSVLNIFNRLYGTNYADLNDFLFKNNFETTKEWQTYVANILIDAKEETLDGSSNFGR